MNLIVNRDFFKKLRALPFIDEIWLYGSRARGDNGDRSDFDIAIICPNATHQDWHTVQGIIDEADTLYAIDCIRFDTLSEDDKFKNEILKDKKVLFKRGLSDE